MITHPERQLENLHERIETSADLAAEDREILQEFSDRLVLLKSEYSSQQHGKLLRHCTIAAEEVGGLAESLKDRDAVKEFVLWINRNYDNEETNKDYRIALRMFESASPKRGWISRRLTTAFLNFSRGFRRPPAGITDPSPIRPICWTGRTTSDR